MAQANQVPFTPANVRRPPSHPAARYVEQPPADTTQPVAPQVTPSQPTTQVSPQPAPQPYQAPISQTTPQPAPQPYQAPMPQPVQQAAPAAWDINVWQQQQAELQRQMATQQQQYAQQLQARQAELEAAQRRIAEFEQAQAQAALSNLTDIDLQGLEHVDSDVAQEIRDKILAPVINRVTQATEARLAQATTLANNALEANSSTMTKWQEEQQRARTADLNRAITARHPDVERVIASPEYSAFMAQVIPGTLVTRGSQIEAAYKAGNADFVNQMLDEFKGGQPGFAQIATPPINQVAATTGVSTEGASFTYADLDDAKYKLSRREMTHEEYRNFLAEFEAAEAQGRVH